MPVEFEYNQSTEQAFYFVIEAHIDGIPIEEGDWLAAFRGEICVGARQWTGEYTDIPVMGDDGEEYSAGYMLPGEYPTFRIFDSSESQIYRALPTQNVGFPSGLLAFFEVPQLNVIHDCFGVLGGDNLEDNCGVCDDDPYNDCDVDCMGIWGGEAFIDDCGVCSGGTSGHEANSDKDECGVCFGNGQNDQGCGCFIPPAEEYWFDEDGDGFGFGESQEFCYADLPPYWVDNNVDPEPLCSNPDEFTLMIDHCGVCAAGGVDDLGCGCYIPAAEEYWYDSDGDGLGAGESEFYCEVDIPTDWVANADDQEPNCSTNDTDHCGVCAGGGADDVGCGCFEPAALKYWFDADEDGFGTGDFELYCLQDVPENWVPNNVDQEEFCWNPDPVTLMIDHCGVCAGGGLDDLGCGCYEPAALEYWFDADNDGMGYGEPQEFCLQNLPNQWVLNDDDLEPECTTNDTDHCGICAGGGLEDQGCGCFKPAPLSYWYDSDGDGLGSGEGLEFCLTDVPENWVTNDDDEYPNCAENFYDHCDVCGGDGSDDVGCGCYNPAALEYWYDSDGDGLGSGDSEFICLQDLTDGWVENSDDLEPDCSTNDTDHCGVCAGGGVDDVGCGCYNPAALEYWYDSDGDGLGSGDSEFICLQDLTDGWVENSDDLEPDCSTNDTDHCGVCAGGGADDVGCGCFELAPTEYCEDTDGDGLGNAGNGDDSSTGCDSDPVTWTVNQADYQYNGSVTTKVHIDGIEVGSASDQVAAFVGDEVRGVVNGLALPPFLGGGYSFNIMVYSNLSSGEEISFKYFDFANDNVICLNETLAFSSDMTVGNAMAPFELTGSSPEPSGGGSELYCEDEVPEGWVPDCTDPEPDCATNDTDDCDVCGGGNADMDCSGVCFGDALEDNCGVCDNDPTNDCASDCAGVWGGSAFVDDCGVCSGGTTGHYANSDIDDCGVCFGENADNLGCGCFLPGEQNYFEDSDGDGLGFGDAAQYCAGDEPNGWVNNDDDLEPECTSNDTDNCGICAGTGSTCASPENISAEGGRNEIHLNWLENVEADFYNIYYTDGELVGSTSENIFTDPPGEGFGLPYDTEFCYQITSVNQIGVEGPASDAVCATTLPYILAGLNIEVDNQSGIANIYLTSLWPILGYQFDVNFNPDYFDVSQVSGLLNPTYGNGTIIGYSILGESIPASPDGILLTTVNFVPNQIDFNESFTLQLENIIISDDGSQPLVSCDSDLDIYNGCDVSDTFEFSVDCNSDWFGSAFVDDCGICSEGNSNHEANSDKDCNGDCFGVAFVDECGNCVEGETGLVENYADLGCGCYNPAALNYCEDTDLDGMGNAESEAPYCLADVPENWILNCTDPEPDCATNDTDHCGICAGGGTDDLGCGCFLPGAIPFYFDSDNDGFGYGEPSNFCDGEEPQGWVQNNSDEYPDCFYNYFDECGVCGGDGSLNQGCGCELPAPLVYCEDTDSDGMGNQGSETEFCLADLPENWTLDCSDPEPDCTTNDTDHCGICAGGGVDDLGCGCFIDPPEDFCIDIDGDGLGAGSPVEYCAADAPEDWVNDCTDEEPFCPTNDTDDCGVCGGDNSSCTGCTDEIAWNHCEACTIDDGSCIYIPDNFGFSQSTAQAFYFVLNADILSDDLVVNEDWIGVFNEDICVGSLPWNGPYSSVPAMGDDGTEWTQGYLNTGDFPTFKIYDGSENAYYDAEAINIYVQEQFFNREYDGWSNFEFFEVERLRAKVPDCAGVVDGLAYIDDCGECVGGTTGVEENWAQDCNGDCFGEAFEDDCGICSEGNSGHTANSDNLGCGCFNPAPLEYWYDADGDGLGSGEPVSLCLDDVSQVWVENSNDEEPFCSTNDTDDCGICAGENQNMDCAGICFGNTEIDDCGICGGDGTSCMAPIAESQSLNIQEDSSIEFILSGYDVNGEEIIDFNIVQSPSNGTITGVIPSLTYIPNLNFNGLDSLLFTVSTELYTSEESPIYFNINAVNDAPNSYDSQYTLDENTSIEFQLSTFDIDGDALTPTITLGPNNGSLIMGGETITYIPNENYFGIDTFNFTVSDGNLNSNESTVSFTVIGVNNLPEVQAIEDSESNEDEDFTVEIIASDVEDDLLIYSATVDGNAEVILSGSQLTILPDLNFNGEILVNVDVTDGLGSVSEQFTLTILPINDAPIIESIASQFIDEDTILELQIDANDIDGDEITFALAESEYYSFSFDENILSLTPSNNFTGNLNIELFASDYDLTTSTEFELNVIGVNDAPTIAEIDAQTINEDDSLILEIIASDDEDDQLSYSASSDGNSQLSFSDSLLTVIPNENFNGDIEITVFVNDGLSTTSTEFTLSILPVNDTPEISVIDDIYMDEDGISSFRIIAIDIDGDELSYSAQAENITFTPNGNQISVQPNENINGTILVEAFAFDGTDSSSTTFNLVINAVNDAPQVLAEIEDVVVEQNSNALTFELSNYFYDVENGNDLSYSAFENNPAVEVEINNGILTLNFIENTIGSGPTTITASDNIDRDVASITFNVDVIHVNQPPVVEDLLVEVNEDEAYTFDISVEDESSELIVSVISGPSNGTIEEINGLQITYLSSENYFGDDQLVIDISDGELSSSMTVDINVLPVNDSPFFMTSTLDDGIELDEYISFIDYDDVDSDLQSVSLTLIMGPSWLSIDDNSLVGTPSNMDAGLYAVTLKIDDGEDATIQDFDLYIENLNEAPQVTDLDLICEEDGSIHLNLFATDSDGDDLSISISQPENGEVSGEYPNLVYYPDPNYFGSDSFTYSANDGINSSSDATVSISILPLNDAPSSSDAEFEVHSSIFDFDLSALVSDPEGDELTFLSVPPSGDTLNTVFGGLVYENGNGGFTYEHPSSFEEGDFLLYKVNDGLAESEISMITFNLYGRSWSRNNPPSAFDDEVTMLEDNSTQLTFVGFDVFNLFPQDGTETVTITQQPAYGTLGDIYFEAGNSQQLAQWVVEYTPSENYNGSDVIRYKVNNPNNDNGDSGEGVIQITINSVNDLPTLSTESEISFLEDENTVLNITFDDVDNDLQLSIGDNENLNIQITSQNESSATLLVSASENYFGQSSFTISISEDIDDGIEITENVSVSVSSVNDAPVLGNINNVEIDEDNQITLNLEASDVDFTSFSYTVSSSNNIETELVGNQLSLIPNENWSGSESLNVTVQDSYGFSDSQSFDIIVNAVNDAPTADSQSHELVEDGVKLIYPSGSDIEDSQLTFSVYDLPEHGNVSVDGWIFTYEPNENYSGEDSFTYISNDGELSSEPALVTLTISGTNDAPIFEQVNAIELNEDSNIDIQLSATDIDGDELSFSIVNADDELGASIVANMLSISPISNFNGPATLMVKVEDAEEYDTQILNVNVLAVNDLPELDAIDDITLNEGESFEIELSASDIDGDDIYFTASSESEFVQVTIEDNNLIITTNDDIGNSETLIEVEASDGSHVDTGTFTVTTINLNDAPISESFQVDVNEDLTASILPQGFDPDGDALTFSLIDSTIYGAIALENGLFIYSPNENFVGSDSFTYLANDGEYDSEISTVNIVVNNVNDQPELFSIDDQVAAEGQSVEIELSATDIDGDELIFSASANDDVVVDIIGNILTITPFDIDFNGTVEIHFQVSDGEYEDLDSFVLIYSATNDIPQIADINDAVINEDAVFIYLIETTDIDGDELLLNVESGENATASISNSILTVTPNENYFGNINVTVSVSDSEFTIFESFILDVLPINDAPMLPDLSTQSAFEDVNFQLQINVDDIDDDEHSIEVEMDTTFVDYYLIGNELNITPTENWYGEILVNVSASDGEYTASQSFNVNFQSVNDSPVIASNAITEASEDMVYNYQLEINDPDNSSFFYTLISGPEGMEIDEDGLITWIPTEGITSSGIVAIVVWDTDNPTSGVDFPAYQQFSIDVAPVNDPPTITSTPVITATEDIQYSYQVTVADIDSDYFTFELSSAPEGMTISNQGLIEWLPAEGVESSGMVEVSVTDVDVENPITITQQFLVVVTPVNDPPIIISVADSTAITGEEYIYQVVVEDPDDDEFTYILFNNPDEMRVNETGLISWIPTLPGTYGPITIAVSDGGEDDVQPVQELFIVVVEAASPLITMDFELQHTANLISFLGIPQDSSVASVLAPIDDNAIGLIGQGTATQNMEGIGWVGSLTDISPTSGYWLKLEYPPVESFVVEAYPTNPLINYELIEGQNIISFVGTDGAGISESIPDDYEEKITGIIGEGSATFQLTEQNWVGSLTELNHLKGYWINVVENMDFNWELVDELTRDDIDKIENPKLPIPEEFNFNQSTQQAFYFVEDVQLFDDEISNYDLLIAYNEETVIGARQWGGAYTDLPAMGYDGFDDTFNYIDAGDVPNFKLFKHATGELIDLKPNNEIEWESNGLHIIQLSQKVEIIEKLSLAPAYPNPFNPETTIAFEIPTDNEVNVAIYDVNGRLVVSLHEGMMMKGQHQITWNASQFASGVYFTRLSYNGQYIQQKLMLVK